MVLANLQHVVQKKGRTNRVIQKKYRREVK